MNWAAAGDARLPPEANPGLRPYYVRRMRIGLMLNVSPPIGEVIDQVQQAASGDFASVWASQIFGYDALTLLAVVGREVPRIELGTAVVPTFPRHPVMLASQALTVQAATEGRLVLGIGLSHQVVVEGVFGHSFDHPARHMDDYLSVLMPLLRGETVSHQGATLRATTPGPLDIKEVTPPTVLVAALGPVMLGLAGRLADGTVTWMVGPKTLERHIVPSITKAASAAGRPSPRVAVGLPVCVTDDVASARERADRSFGRYGDLPSYRAMLDREGAAGPAEVAVVGNQAAVGRQVRSLADGGATDFIGAPFGSADQRRRTLEVLGAL